jgi:hypothetical protein
MRHVQVGQTELHSNGMWSVEFVITDLDVNRFPVLSGTVRSAAIFPSSDLAQAAGQRVVTQLDAGAPWPNLCEQF